MCKMSAPQPPPVPEVSPAPTREQVVAAQKKQAGEKAAQTIKQVEDEAKRREERQGMYGNIKTSMSGDWYYRKRSKPVARFKGQKKAA